MSRERFCVGFGRTRIDIEGERGRAVLGSCGRWRAAGPCGYGRRTSGCTWRRCAPTMAGDFIKCGAPGRRVNFCWGPWSPGGGLHLERRVPGKTLQRQGAWPLIGGKIVMAYSFTDRDGMQEVWHREDHPENFCRDRVVRACLRGAQGVLSREKGAIRQLAIPFSTCEPILLNTLFCLAQVREKQGQRHLVWSFDWEGRASAAWVAGGERQGKIKQIH